MFYPIHGPPRTASSRRQNSSLPLAVTGHLDIHFLEKSWPAVYLPQQIAFRYRVTDSASGVTRETAKRLAGRLGVDETQAIHQALHEPAIKILPQYEADDGPLSATQLRQIKKHAPQANKRPVRSSLFDIAPAKK